VRCLIATLFVAVLAENTPASAATSHLPFPSYGQAAIALEGAGLLGTSGNVSTPHPTASVAKVMDAYQVLTDHPLGVNDSGPIITVLASEAKAYQAARNSGQTLVPVYAGERISERNALEAMLLPSANDMARILARWDAGSISAFVAKENRMAAKLGMTHTHFSDPAGVDSHTVSTAPDLVKLDQAAMAVPTFARVVSETSAKVPAAGVVHNSNRLLGQGGVIGTKTGWTSPAGGCLMFAARVKARDGSYKMVYGVVLGMPGSVPASAKLAAATARKLVDAARAAAQR
jgi:serine-type D-Ala-D-Ala carboxypeptidase (penicillin-binding protein 5/6)